MLVIVLDRNNNKDKNFYSIFLKDTMKKPGMTERGPQHNIQEILNFQIF